MTRKPLAVRVILLAVARVTMAPPRRNQMQVLCLCGGLRRPSNPHEAEARRRNPRLAWRSSPLAVRMPRDW
jgi:hypothetical protein